MERLGWDAFDPFLNKRKKKIKKKKKTDDSGGKIKECPNQLRSATQQLSTRGAKCTEVDGGFLNMFCKEKYTIKQNIRKNDDETDQEEEKELIGSLAEKKLATEGCTGRNGEREKSSGEKKISDDRRH
ncbi:hypothetical protein ANN_22228 [Periplaneta americana]|uniref:Uncharacterized protein n=1 Tax=Periplaneta americana TaxID=6978 RepID=A0ABQ8S8G0_PERAM|nr:hypothetical protein ANN_22228 [Periplaneta americana]